MVKSELNPWALGGAIGLVYGLYMAFIAAAAALGWAPDRVAMLTHVYIGFSATSLGAIIGFVWGFVEGFLCGALIAVFYNFFIKTCPLCK